MTANSINFEALCKVIINDVNKLNKALSKVQDWKGTEVGDALNRLNAVTDLASLTTNAYSSLTGPTGLTGVSGAIGPDFPSMFKHAYPVDFPQFRP